MLETNIVALHDHLPQISRPSPSFLPSRPRSSRHRSALFYLSLSLSLPFALGNNNHLILRKKVVGIKSSLQRAHFLPKQEAPRCPSSLGQMSPPPLSSSPPSSSSDFDDDGTIASAFFVQKKNISVPLRMMLFTNGDGEEDKEDKERHRQQQQQQRSKRDSSKSRVKETFVFQRRRALILLLLRRRRLSITRSV